MSAAVLDYRLSDLIERLRNVANDLDRAIWDGDLDELRDAAEIASATLDKATAFLTELRYAEHARRG